MSLYVCIFSFWFVLTRLGVNGSNALSPIDIIFFRYVMAALILLPTIRKIPIKRLGLFNCVFVASCIGVVYNLFAFYGLTLFQSNHSAVIITGSIPVFSSLYAFLGTKSLSKHIYISAILIIASIALFLSNNPYQHKISPTQQWLGLGLLLGSALLYSLGMWGINKHSLAPIEAITATTYISLCIIVPFFLLWGNIGVVFSEPYSVLAQALYQGIAVSVLSVFLLSKTISHIGSLKASFFIAFVPVLTTFFAFLMKESINLLDISAAILCTLGIMISVRSRSQKNTNILSSR